MFEIVSGKVQKAKKVVAYGPEGVGKSSLAAQFPRPIFIDTEGSTTEMDVQRLPKPSSWEMLKQQVQWVKQQGNRFGALVIDTIDWAEMLCVESVCATHSKNGIEDFGYGKGYIFVAEEIGRFLNLLQDLVEVGIHVVLTAHAQIVKFEQPDEMGAYDRYQLKLGAKTGSRTAPLVKEWADIVLFINYKTFSVATDKDGKKNKAQGGARTMYTTHHPAWDAKNRHGLPDELPLEYSRIAHIFNQPAQGVTATPTQPPVTTPPAPASTPPSDSAPAVTQTSADAQSGQTAGLSPNIPQSLRDLMTQYQVTESEIQMVVSVKGYYPLNTPIANYDPNFIDGVLVGAWSKVFEMVQDAREKTPF
ncbi:ATP-binding protein [Paenibacillus sp. FSL R5-0407]|uniref:ATP-binding protein n=1 Tax=Paenibacillus sp. FSL R5-0407 TaxID=2975320 RepID=UPI0030FBEC99